MIISFNTGKINTTNSGGGNLQQKKVTITENGLDVVLPDNGFNGISTLYIKTNVEGGGSSFKDFSSIGYDDEENIAMNQQMDNDLEYSKTLYDKWNVSSTKLSFEYDYNLVYPPLIDTSNVTDFTNFFRECYKVQYIPKYDFTKGEKLNSCFNACKFKYCDISHWDTSNIKDNSALFANCGQLLSADLSKNDWSSLTVSTSIFNACSKLKSADVTNLIKAQTSVQDMFNTCVVLTSIVGLDSWDVSNVSDFYETFSECKELPNEVFKQIEGWKVVKPTRFTGTFYNCKKLTDLDLSGWRTSTLTNVNSMFTYDMYLTDLNITGWDLSKITNTSSWFSSCSGLVNLKFGYDIKYSFSLSNSSKLTEESLLSVLNGLYDYVGNGVSVPSSSYGKLTLGSTNLAKLTDEQKAIATLKGWTLS